MKNLRDRTGSTSSECIERAEGAGRALSEPSVFKGATTTVYSLLFLTLS